MNCRLFVIGLFFVFVCACASKQPQDALISPATQEQTAPIQTQTAPVQTQPVPAEKETASPVSSAAKAPETKTTVLPEAVPQKKQEVPEVSSVSAPQEIPEDFVKQARANQTLSAPAEDMPVFKDEELISLEGRLLSPLAYEPVSATAEQTAPWKNEELKYGLYYSFIKAGTAYIKNRGITDINGRKAYLIQTSAFSAPVIDAVYKVRDINLSWLDTQNFYSLGYAQSLREGRYKRDEWLTFDYNKNTYYGEVRKKEEPRIISGELPIKVLDMLTSLYYVRAQKLEVGKDIVFDIINREKQYPLVVKVLGKETIKTDAGKFDCIKVEPMFRGEGIFVSKGKSLQVWLTDDEYKMPIKMKVEVFIGSVYAELLEYKRN